mmetsp:Transcript_147295/g.455653  ORF Transcript_147295/g.455653 Transcript_147295/m.455653 type:complete len:447 (-) Transcript_147295:22-1362(-)
MTLQVSTAGLGMEGREARDSRRGRARKHADAARRFVSEPSYLVCKPSEESEAPLERPLSAFTEPFGDDEFDICRQSDPNGLRLPGIAVERRKYRHKTTLPGAAGHRFTMHTYSSDPGIPAEESLAEDPFSEALEEDSGSGEAVARQKARDPTPTVPASILKKLDLQELSVYFQLWHVLRDDPVLRFVPELQGVVEETDASGLSSKYLRMGNLLHDFRQNARVMDVKLGVRTYVEAECSNTAGRPDLYAKMQDTYPWELTEAERAAEAVTKHRWMSVHDANTTSSSLGFRLDGVVGYSRTETEDLCKAFYHLRKRSEVADWLLRFAEDAACEADGRRRASPARIAEDLTERLKALTEALQASEFFRGYECIGSSALLVADADGKVGAFWIDFAKARALPDGIRVSHRAPWLRGNHEDGVLTGLDSLVELWGEVAERLASDEDPFGQD